MINEIAILNIRKGERKAFEKSFSQAKKIIASMHGYVQHQLLKCIEEENKYILIVDWNKIEDHTDGFRKSEKYKEWKRLLHHYYEPFPLVEHYEQINAC